jgi:tetratricopeptide (TPR) repeat protein
MEMKKIIDWVIVLLIAASLFSCSKKLVPEGISKKSGKSYSEAVFNYLYVEAIKMKLQGNNGDALKYLEQCIKLNPESDAAFYQVAQILASSGDINNSKNFLKRAISINRENVWYLVMMAGLYYQTEQLDSAIFYYEKAVNNFPERENLLMTLGNLYSQNKNFDKARDVFESFDKKYGVNETSTISSVKTLIAAGKFDEALGKTEMLLKEFPDNIVYNGLLAEVYRGKGDNEKAFEVYDSVIRKNPDSPQTQLSLCDFLISQKNYNDLFKIISNVIVNEKVAKEDKMTLMARIIDIPEIAESKRNELAILLMILESGYKEDMLIPLLRVDLFVKNDDLEKASERLEEIIKINPGNYYAWEKLLIVYLQMKDYKKLMLKGEECATNFNRSFLAKILYANGAMENGKYDIALEELRKAEILAGDNNDMLIQMLTMKADVYYKMRDFRKAFEIFDNALKINKEDLTVINNYAYYLAEQNMRLKDAESMARKVIEKEKRNTNFLDTYAWVLYKRGKVNEAVRVMESVITSGQKADAEWYEHYGYMLRKQRRCDKAIESWKTAMKLDQTKGNLIKEIENCKR